MYQDLTERLKNIKNILSASSLFTWDMNTYMPSGASDDRGDILASISKVYYDMLTDNSLEKLVDDLLKDNSLDSKQIKNVEIIKDDISKTKKTPSWLVQELAKQESNTYNAWNKAREKDDFNIFAKEFEKLLELRKKEAEHIGYTDNIYDVFLDKFDPGLSTLEIDNIFQELKPKLKDLISQFQTKEDNFEVFEKKEFDNEKIHELLYEILNEIGYDFSKGRLDISIHPFTTAISQNDIRITTRISKTGLIDTLMSTIHEAGHALCEFGKNKNDYGLPSGEIRSLALHESQSMIWELYIAKNPEFWRYFWNLLNKYFPEQFKDTSIDDFVKILHEVKPSLIRTTADQLTYHMHIIIRYEMEKELLQGEIKVQDMPEVWNKKYKDYLGVSPNSLKDGVLQDIHWAYGEFGYFPVYSLGNMFGAWIYQNIEKSIGSLDEIISNGEFYKILSYLNQNIHQKGSLEKSIDLINSLGKENFSVDFYIDFMKKKLEKTK